MKNENIINENLLEIKNLETIYKSDEFVVNAVNKVNLSLKKGNTLGIVGETGAGKTTMALSILKLLPERSGKIVSGEVKFAGKDLIKLSETEMYGIRGKLISMIFQDPMTSLNPAITVGEQIAEAIRIHNKDKMNKKEINEEVDKLLELVGIQPSRKREYPHQFSGGMKQRVVIAISLACEPELIIADEPTTALDVTIQAQVLAMLDELKTKFRTSMILITHDLGLVAENCDTVAVMYAGEIIESGTVEDIFEKDMHHPYTIGLFNSIPDLEKETDRLIPVEGLMPDPTNLPTGCKFHPRCTKCMDICKEIIPEDYIEGEHSIKCHLFAKER